MRENNLFPSLMKPVIRKGKRNLSLLILLALLGNAKNCHKKSAFFSISLRASLAAYLTVKWLKPCDKGQIPIFSTTFPPTPIQCNSLEQLELGWLVAGVMVVPSKVELNRRWWHKEPNAL